jgi:hypothetical protein
MSEVYRTYFSFVDSTLWFSVRDGAVGVTEKLGLKRRSWRCTAPSLRPQTPELSPGYGRGSQQGALLFRLRGLAEIKCHCSRRFSLFLVFKKLVVPIAPYSITELKLSSTGV